MTRQILGGFRGGGDEEIIQHHRSMRELAAYLKFHNLMVGEPRPNTPYVSIEKANGQPLDPEELQTMHELGITREGYKNRTGLVDINPDRVADIADLFKDTQEELRKKPK